MPGPIGTATGFVSRGLPQPAPDYTYREERVGRYGSQIVEALFATKHGVADEGSYFTAADSAGRATVAAPTAFSDTAPLWILTNQDSVTNPAGKRIYMDYLRAVETAAGTAGVSFFIKTEIDYIVRYSSAGNAVTPNNVNGDIGVKSVAQVFTFPTTVAAGGSVRTINANACVLPTMSAAIAASSEWAAYFGGDGIKTLGTQGANGWAASSLPPLIIGPGQCLVVPFLITSQSATSSWQIEAGWWER